MFLNTECAWEGYVDNKKVYSQIPFMDSINSTIKFIPIVPKEKLNVAKKGVAFVRFSVAKIYADFFVKVYRSLDKSFHKLIESNREIVQQTTMLVPFNNERVENVFVVTFPENGKFLVEIWICDIGSTWSHNCLQLIYHVNDAIKQFPVSPYQFLYEGRKFLPLLNSQITVEPPDSTIITNSSAFNLYVSIPKGAVLLLNLLPLKNYSVLERCSEVRRTTELNGKVNIRYQLNMSHYGTFELNFFLDHSYIFQQIYYYQSNIPKPTAEELQLQSQLKKEIFEPYDELWDIREHFPEYFSPSTRSNPKIESTLKNKAKSFPNIL
jgi:hypothetical protein